MGLMDYRGRTPPGYDGTTVDRIAHHRRWNVEEETWSDCTNCGTELRLRDDHLLVTLASSRANVDRLHLCDERCLDEWFGEVL